jgi:hypothetical protein
LLLPLLKLLRLIVATPDSLLPSEAARKLRADLVGLLLTSGGLHDLQRVCMTSTATLERASGAAPLLLQFVALLHALLLPLRADKAAACAAPLKAFLDESALCGEWPAAITSTSTSTTSTSTASTSTSTSTTSPRSPSRYFRRPRAPRRRPVPRRHGLVAGDGVLAERRRRGGRRLAAAAALAANARRLPLGRAGA